MVCWGWHWCMALCIVAWIKAHWLALGGSSGVVFLLWKYWGELMERLKKTAEAWQAWKEVPYRIREAQARAEGAEARVKRIESEIEQVKKNTEKTATELAQLNHEMALERIEIKMIQLQELFAKEHGSGANIPTAQDYARELNEPVELVEEVFARTKRQQRLPGNLRRNRFNPDRFG